MSHIPHDAPAKCPVCRAGIVRRIAGFWCPRCRGWLVTRPMLVFGGAADNPAVMGWGIRTER